MRYPLNSQTPELGAATHQRCLCHCHAGHSPAGLREGTRTRRDAEDRQYQPGSAPEQLGASLGVHQALPMESSLHFQHSTEFTVSCRGACRSSCTCPARTLPLPVSERSELKTELVLEVENSLKVLYAALNPKSLCKELASEMVMKSCRKKTPWTPSPQQSQSREEEAWGNGLAGTRSLSAEVKTHEKRRVAAWQAAGITEAMPCHLATVSADRGSS